MMQQGTGADERTVTDTNRCCALYSCESQLTVKGTTVRARTRVPKYGYGTKHVTKSSWLAEESSEMVRTVRLFQFPRSFFNGV